MNSVKFINVHIVDGSLDMSINEEQSLIKDNNKMLKECKYCFHWSTKYNECRHYPIPHIVNNICKSKFIII